MGTLKVYFQDTPCGTLTEGIGGTLQFEYLDAWIDGGRHQISVRLPVCVGQCSGLNLFFTFLFS